MSQFQILVAHFFEKPVPQACFFYRYDRDEPLSATLNFGSAEHEKVPFVLRSQPHIIVQSPEPIKPWVKAIGYFLYESLYLLKGRLL